MAKCLHIVGNVDVRCDDPDARRAISVQFVCGTDSDDGQAAAGMVSLNLSQEVATYVVTDEEDFVEKKKSLVVDGKAFCLKMRTPGEEQKTILVKRGQQNSSPALFGSSGVKLQTPFFPGQIQINTSTGLITVLPTNSSLGDIPRSMPSTAGQPQEHGQQQPQEHGQPQEHTAGQPQEHTFRQLIPGMNIALLAWNGYFVGAEHGGDGPLIANRTILGRDETFAVVNGNISGYENGIGLRSHANGKYVTCAADGMSLIASQASLSSRDFFVEVDAGAGKVALRSVHAEQYVGRDTQLGLVPWLREYEMFVVKLVVNAI